MADVQNTKAVQMYKLWSQPSCYLAVQEMLHKHLFKTQCSIWKLEIILQIVLILQIRKQRKQMVTGEPRLVL